MDSFTKKLLSFLDGSPSSYHAVENVKNILEEAGYTRLLEGEKWAIQPGGKYFVMRNQSALLAFRIPEGNFGGFMLSASHSDRPTFRVKERTKLDTPGDYTRIAVERYGGMLMSTWLDRPLSVAGRVLINAGGKVESRLVALSKDLLLIPNVAIHMNRSANDNMSYNPAVDLLPILGGADCKDDLMEQVAESAGVQKEDILSADLYLYNRQKATVWGTREEYVSAQGLDDLQCAFATLEGFLQAEEGQSAPIYCLFDNEEVGSCTRQGADSAFLKDTLSRVCEALGMDLRQAMAQSMLVSADNAHAQHPNHPEYADSGNRPQMNGGIVIKHSANQRYATDGLSEAVFRMACQKADVPVQDFYNRADLPGGSTLGNISISQLAVSTVDIGLPQLAMHSSYETAGVKDGGYLVRAMAAFFAMSCQELV